MPALSLHDIQKTFPKNIQALRGVCLEVRDGELLVLAGPSGCGKTTTLRVIAGLETPDSGEVHIADRRVDGLPPRDRDVAMIFQNQVLFPHMSVLRNLLFPSRPRQTAGEDLTDKAQSFARELEIGHLLDRKPEELSGGERQRVALARLLTRGAGCNLLDEPLAHLDPLLRWQALSLIKSWQRRFQATMVYVTHDQREALTIADRIGVMRDGQLHQVDSPQKIFGSPRNRFVMEFLSPTQTAFIPGRLEQAAGSWIFHDASKLSWPLPPEWKTALERYGKSEIVLGLRPSAVRYSLSEKPPTSTDQEKQSTAIPARVVGHEFTGEQMYMQWEAISDSRRWTTFANGETPSIGSTGFLHIDLDEAIPFAPGPLGMNLLSVHAR